jgi:hypothetical protein
MLWKPVAVVRGIAVSCAGSITVGMWRRRPTQRHQASIVEQILGRPFPGPPLSRPAKPA